MWEDAAQGGQNQFPRQGILSCVKGGELRLTRKNQASEKARISFRLLFTVDMMGLAASSS